MTRTHHWIIAILFTSLLLCVGTLITLMNKKNAQIKPNLPLNDNASLALKTSVSSTSMTQKMATQKAQQILPVDKVESVTEVNYEGKHAFQINTNQNTLYLNAKTAEVIAMTPRLDAKPKLVQVNYEQPNNVRSEHEEHHGHESEEGDD